MPPKVKVKKEDIINISYEIVQECGMENLNARTVAQKLHCSIQPIFHNFATMEELKISVIEKIYETYKQHIIKGQQENGYKGMGLAYIKFAQQYPHFFKILFMSETKLTIQNFISHDNIGEELIKSGQQFTGLSYQEQQKFHFKVWIFTHGLATLVATKTCELKDEEIEKLLTTTVKQMLNNKER